ncbi:unnamed protein product [Laminaria digitata]
MELPEGGIFYSSRRLEVPLEVFLSKQPKRQARNTKHEHIEELDKMNRTAECSEHSTAATTAA